MTNREPADLHNDFLHWYCDLINETLRLREVLEARKAEAETSEKLKKKDRQP